MLGSILIFLLVLSILVIVHELGHFIMARRAGILVEEFGFGLPPRLFGKKIGETFYSINALPFGGFVRLHGEAPDEKAANPGRSFSAKSKKTRAGIVIAGVIMNLLLGIACFAIVYSSSGIPRVTQEVKIVEVTAGSPAQVAGIVVGDVIKKVNGGDITSDSEFISLIESQKGKRIILDIQRGEEKNVEVKKITIIPREAPPEGEGPLGVVITDTEIYYPPALARPFVGIYYGVKEAIFWGKTVVMGLVTVITSLFAGEVPKDLSGPVGIFAITSEAAKIGTIALINFIGILSINLAILNILPFPALDGGRLAFIALEGVLGRRVVPKVEAMAHTIGMIILLLLIFAITARDIQRLIVAGGITGFIESIIK